jgi:hypothetical protein
MSVNELRSKLRLGLTLAFSWLLISVVLSHVAKAGTGDGVRVGAAAPAFTTADSNGKPESLDQYRGKFVVLEWHNHGRRRAWFG